MSTLTKTYILFGMLLASITKFSYFSWQNFLSVLILVILLVYYQLGIDEQREQKKMKEKIDLLKGNGEFEEARKLEQMLPIKKSFIEKMKDKMENDDERF